MYQSSATAGNTCGRVGTMMLMQAMFMPAQCNSLGGTHIVVKQQKTLHSKTVCGVYVHT